MTEITHSRSIPAPAEKIWQTVRSFGLHYIQDFPHTLSGAGIGAERAFKVPAGDMIERIFAFDDPGMRLSYRIVQSPWPVRDYSATIQVEPAETGSTVTWSASFQPAEGMEKAAAETVEGTILFNLRKLEKWFSA